VKFLPGVFELLQRPESPLTDLTRGGKEMKTRIFNRAVGILLSAFLLCASIPAQDALGPNRFLNPPAPTLRSAASLSRVFRAGRPLLGYVGRVGGVAFDGVASPANGLKIDSLTLSYSPTRNDGNRLVLGLNGKSEETSLYDWQLIPVAKFANSDDPSCVTLFGHLDTPEMEEQIRFEQILQGSQTRFLNYHPSFNNTLMGLRLFQLDALIINPYSYELPTEKGKYILGAGESITKEENQRHHQEFVEYNKQNQKTFESALSYVITDNGQEITFDITGGKLTVRGEPYYYFWTADKDQYENLLSGYSLLDAKTRLRAEMRRRIRPVNSLRAKQAWLASQLRDDIARHASQIDDVNVEFLGYRDLLDLIKKDETSRELSLSKQPVPWLTDRLAELRTVETMPVTSEVTELRQMLSSRMEMVRGINPAVWDAGATVMRYAAFFRYVKANYPQTWQSFMAQIERAHAPQPSVKTPTVMSTPVL